MNKLYKVIVLPDTQIPFHDVLTMKAVEKYMADERWDEWLQLGDLLDYDQISHWNDGKPESLVRGLEGDYKIANEILDRHQAIVRKKNPKAKFTVLAGNHCIRPEKFVEKNPQMKGLIEMEHGLRFKERGIKYVKCYPKGEIHQIGNAYFTHGLYTGTNHAKKHVDNFGVSVFYGHTHQCQSFSKVLWGKNKTVVGESLGCLCRYDLPYVGENPTAWQQAVTTFYFRPDGYFNHFVSRIFNHKFTAPNGKTYGPN